MTDNNGDTRPRFLDGLGEDLHAGRARLSDRRRRTNMAAGMAAVLALVIGGTIAASNLSGDSPSEVAVGDSAEDNSSDGGEEADNSGSESGESLNPEFERYRCSVLDQPAVAMVDGPLSDDPDIAEIQQQRADVGLPSTEAAARNGRINDVAAASIIEPGRADMRMALGFPLTAEELELVLGGGGPNSQSVSDSISNTEEGQARLDSFIARFPDTYAGRWIDGTKLGRPLTLAFVEGLGRVEEIQSELDAEFGNGVFVAAQADFTLAELQAFRADIVALNLDGLQGHGIEEKSNRLSVSLSVFNDESIQAIIDAVGTEGWCADGADPADVVPTGDQPTSGDGWRLLTHFDGGNSYASWVATTPAQFEELEGRLGLADSLPDVDFEQEIVIWFGAVYGSGCEDVRLDGLIIKEDGTVHADMVLPGGSRGCNDDANPRAYILAVERDFLPPAPFTVQYSAEPPGCCVDTERTEVTAALLAGTEDPPPLAPRLPQVTTVLVDGDEPFEEDEFAVIRELATAIIGLNEAEALDQVRAEGFEVSVQERDGEQLVQPGLITAGLFRLFIEDDLVIRVLVEGEEPAGNVIVDETGILDTPLSVRELGNELIGLPEDEALALLESEGHDARVVGRDGIGVPVTFDLRPGRFNLEITDGLVSDVTVEAQQTAIPNEPEFSGEPIIGDGPNAEFAQQLIGMTDDEALNFAFSNGFEARVIERDGEPQPVTRDLRPGRLNLILIDALVVQVVVEGSDAGIEDDNRDIGGIAEAAWGLPQADAFALVAEAGFEVRVSDLDSPPVTLPADRRINRFTLGISNGIVVTVGVEAEAPRNDIRIDQAGERTVGGFARSYLGRISQEIKGLPEAEALQILQDAGIPGGTISRDGEAVPRTSESFDQSIFITIVDGSVASTRVSF